MFIAYNPPTLLYFALPIGVFAIAVAAMVRIAARQTQEKQALATRRGWILQPKPEKDIAWRMSGDGVWTLDAVLTLSCDEFITTYTFSAPRRRDSAGETGGTMRTNSRKMAQWMAGEGGQKAQKLARGLGNVMGASFDKIAGELAAKSIEFSRPDLEEFCLVLRGITERQALETFGDAAQSAFLRWRASLPQHQQHNPNLIIGLENSTLRVASTESLESAARIEAFLEFCTALKR